MSRNFELLNQMGQSCDVPRAVEPDAVSAPEVATVVPSLPIHAGAKEEITKLVYRLFSLDAAEGPQRVVFACTESGSGNTWICARVGDILASQGPGSVCVVDCNFRSPALHREFGVEDNSGLADALRRDGSICDYARQLRSNLWIVSAGTSAEDAQQLLTSDRMRTCLAELTAEFDYVLMDVAALNSCHHGLILGSLSDGVALVLKANSTRRDAARQALQELQAAKVPILGAVLNQRTFPIPEKIYSRL